MDYQRRKHQLRFWLLAVSAAVLLLVSAAAFWPSPFYQVDVDVRMKPLQPMVTPNTTRLYGRDVYETAAAISQTIYPATFKDNKPGAVILVPADDWRVAVTAVGLVHFPINAPILYIKKDEIPEATLKEMERLDPEGNFMDSNTKVYVVGDVEEAVLQELKKKKLKYRWFAESDYRELAYRIDAFKATMEADHQDEVILLPAEHPEYALVAGPWVAHMGHSILFVQPDRIPEATIRALEKRPVDAYLYLFGPESAISKEIALRLAEYGHIQRIPGENPAAFSAGFAGYKDVGRNQGYWFWQSTRSFGWGVSEAGHNVTIVNPENWEHAVAASILSHMGKHGPMLWVNRDAVPKKVEEYLQLIKPFYLSNQEQLFNFGWIIGDSRSITIETQREIDRLLQVKMK